MGVVTADEQHAQVPRKWDQGSRGWRPIRRREQPAGQRPVQGAAARFAFRGRAGPVFQRETQGLGAFTARGALYAVLSQPGSETAKGLVTFSSGNHGQAVALAAKELGVGGNGRPRA